MPAFTSAKFLAILLSLKVATAAALLSLPFGFAMTYLLTYRRFGGAVVLDVAVNLPLTLPPVVIGYLLLILLGHEGPIDRMILRPLGIKLIFTLKAAVIARSVIGFPPMVRPIPLSSIIREMPQDYNNYIQAFREKDGIHGHDV